MGVRRRGVGVRERAVHRQTVEVRIGSANAAGGLGVYTQGVRDGARRSRGAGRGPARARARAGARAGQDDERRDRPLWAEASAGRSHNQSGRECSRRGGQAGAGRGTAMQTDDDDDDDVVDRLRLPWPFSPNSSSPSGECNRTVHHAKPWLVAVGSARRGPPDRSCQRAAASSWGYLTSSHSCMRRARASRSTKGSLRHASAMAVAVAMQYHPH